MSVHRVLTWLCERPQGDFTVGWVLRCGWPGFASVVLLPKQLELGRAARLIDIMEKDGIVGPPDGTKPRELLKGRDWIREYDESLK